MTTIKTIGLLGGGVIGAGWAARAALTGHDAVICDLDPEAERKVGEVMANARRAYARMTLAPLTDIGTIRVVRSIEEAAACADFIQESLPENEEVKIPLLARADKVARPDVIIASSTSGLLPSRLQSGMVRPERFVVGHPFNPVYLMPLVEVCGGDKTSDATKQRAMEFYRAIGMHPLHVRKEIDGFIADRLMEALWREALWLIHDDVATAAEIDDAVRFGPGLRWAFMGTFLVYRIAGGEPGMRHFMAQFGPTLKWPWTKLMEVPDLDEELLEKIVAQSDAQAGTASIRELERKRDDCLVSIFQALRGHDFGAGATLKSFEERLFKFAGATAAPSAKPGEPLCLIRTRVDPAWVDYNGHMAESRYLQVFGDATDATMRHVGIDAAYLQAGMSYYTVETHIMHRREVHEGEPIHVTTQVLGADDKRMHLFHSLHKTADDSVLASAEQMFLHVNAKEGRACAARPDVLARIKELAGLHAALPRPEAAGRRIAMPNR
ncbi:MAG: carnitine 3-dehydrogenase [Alphaproteobacteria bacterium]|nr:carnitine 3-dehydrogenase [Alphaproteobacteria bacterium]